MLGYTRPLPEVPGSNRTGLISLNVETHPIARVRSYALHGWNLEPEIETWEGQSAILARGCKFTENLESDNCKVDNNYFVLGLKSPATIGPKNQVGGENQHKSLLQEPPT